MTTVALTAALGALGAVAVAPSAGAVTGHPAGVYGTPFTLATTNLASYDVAAAPGGTAYVGWISSPSGTANRQVHLCKLAISSNSCTGGVQTIASLGISSANGLRVLVDGNDLVHLIWFHDTDLSINGPMNAAIAEATALHGQNLTAAHDIVNAPSFGQLLDAELGPGGIWTVSYANVPNQILYVWHTNAAGSASVATPFGIGFAQIAFTSGTPMLAIDKYGFTDFAPRWATRSSTGTWSAFHALPNTSSWGGDTQLESTGHGLRLITHVNNASYRPVITTWNGTGWTPRSLTADSNSCGPSTHDAWHDASGRLLDASWECHNLTVTNYADAYHAAIFRLGVSSTPTFEPQIASGTRGIATVAYSVQVNGVNGNLLRIARFRLPDSTHTVAHSGTGGTVTVTGPRSCLPPVNVHVGWTHHAASGWTFKSGALRLNGNVFASTTLDGATLAAGASYTLTATAHYGRNGNTSTVKASLSFSTCANG